MKINQADKRKNLVEVNSVVDIEIFDPPMCCSTGLCGPTLDQTLIDVGEMISELQNKGYRVERYQMTTHPQAFLSNPEVMRLVREKQLEILPIVIVRGKILTTGKYPTGLEINTILNGGN